MFANPRWRGFAYIAAALCCYVLFLLVTLPAYWADWLLNRVSHNAVRLQQSEGTLWNGAGNLVLQSAGQERLQNRIAWQLQPLWLFTGKLQAHLNSLDSSLPLNVTIRVGYHHLSVRDLEATLPMSLLSAFDPAIDLVAPSGRLQITSPQVSLTSSGMEGEAQLTWLGAGARMGGLSEIGDYRLVANGRGPSVDLRIETLRGEVAITGQGNWQWQGDGLLRLSGTLTPGSREQNLLPLLAMVNAQNNNGQYNWTLTRRLPPTLLFGSAGFP
jgi:general secretion pathway protein N